MVIYYADGTVTSTDKRKGVWFTVNTKGVKRVRKLKDNIVYDEPKRVKI
jgi:20S proteasome alpha/beta subunit